MGSSPTFGIEKIEGLHVNACKPFLVAERSGACIVYFYRNSGWFARQPSPAAGRDGCEGSAEASSPRPQEKSCQVTMRYAHLAPDHLKATAERLDFTMKAEEKQEGSAG